jgi:F0F1-type ATP synthase membrane subunit c/vacuolar-type H+-ATPase subunit K
MASAIILGIAYASYLSGMALSRKIFPNAHILVQHLCGIAMFSLVFGIWIGLTDKS